MFKPRLQSIFLLVLIAFAAQVILVGHLLAEDVYNDDYYSDRDSGGDWLGYDGAGDFSGSDAWVSDSFDEGFGDMLTEERPLNIDKTLYDHYNDPASFDGYNQDFSIADMEKADMAVGRLGASSQKLGEENFYGYFVGAGGVNGDAYLDEYNRQISEKVTPYEAARSVTNAVDFGALPPVEPFDTSTVNEIGSGLRTLQRYGAELFNGGEYGMASFANRAAEDYVDGAIDQARAQSVIDALQPQIVELHK